MSAPAATAGATEILVALKAVAPEHRMDALAIATRVFCDTKGTLTVGASPSEDTGTTPGGTT